MSKRALCFILTLIMTTSILFGSICSAKGEEISVEENSLSALNESEETSTTVPPATISTARFPSLSVTLISNYFSKTSADYNEYTKEFTIKFKLHSSKELLSVNWTLSYDSEVLKIDPSKNTLNLICPTMSKSSSVSFDDENGLVEFNATDMSMYDFTNEESDFVRIVFDAPNLTPNDTEITKVDLSVEDLWVSEPDPKTGLSLVNKEICLVKKGNVISNARTKEVSVSKHTQITPSTFHDSNYTPSTKDEANTTTVKPTEKPTAAPTSATSPQNNSKDNSDAKIFTGEWYIALIILVMLLICSIVLFIMRKRDIYNN